MEIAKRARKHETNEYRKTEKKALRMFSKDGRPLNINQAKVDFRFSDEDPSQFVLDIAVYKYLIRVSQVSWFFISSIADIWIQVS